MFQVKYPYFLSKIALFDTLNRVQRSCSNALYSPRLNPARAFSCSARGEPARRPGCYDTWDIQYAYTHAFDNSSLGTANFTVGVIDLMNADLPLFRRGSFDASVFDGRGRRWYARVLWQL